MSDLPAITPEREAELIAGCGTIMQRVFAALKSAAEAGVDTPNDVALGARALCSRGAAGLAVRQLHTIGLIHSVRYGAGRQVTILSSGKATARPPGKLLANSWKATRADLPASARALLPPPEPVAMPESIDREPCFYCGVRGDIGCRHRRSTTNGTG